MKPGFPSACLQCKGKLERDGMVARCFTCRLSYTSAGHMISWKAGADPQRKSRERTSWKGRRTALTARVEVGFTEAEKRALEAMATERGRAVSALVRDVTKRELYAYKTQIRKASSGSTV